MELGGALNAAAVIPPAPVELGAWGGGPHKRSKHFGEQKIILPCRDSNPGPSSWPPNRYTDRAADGGVF